MNHLWFVTITQYVKDIKHILVRLGVHTIVKETSEAKADVSKVVSIASDWRHSQKRNISSNLESGSSRNTSQLACCLITTHKI